MCQRYAINFSSTTYTGAGHVRANNIFDGVITLPVNLRKIILLSDISYSVFAASIGNLDISTVAGVNALITSVSFNTVSTSHISIRLIISTTILTVGQSGLLNHSQLLINAEL